LQKHLSYQPIQGLLTCLLAIFLIAGCAATSPRKQSLQTNLQVNISNDTLLRLTRSTKTFTLKAYGQFKSGDFYIENKHIEIPQTTNFAVELSLPVDDPTSLSTKNATGCLSLNNPIQIQGVSLPKKIVLSQGVVTGEFDLLRSLSAYIMELLHRQVMVNHSTKGDTIGSLVANLVIQSAQMELRPQSQLKLGEQEFNIGNSSKILLNNLVLDKERNYRGHCHLDVNLLKHNSVRAPQVDCRFSTGSLSGNLEISRIGSVLALTSDKPQQVVLNDCDFTFGKEKQNQAHCQSAFISVKNFSWQNETLIDKSTLSLSADMAVRNTNLVIKGKHFLIEAVLPYMVPTTLAIDTTEQSTSFSTCKESLAQTTTITVMRPKTTLKLELLATELGKIALRNSGELDFSLPQGKAQLSRVVWNHKRLAFDLLADKGSQLSITKGLGLALLQAPKKLKAVYPLSIKAKKACLANASGKLILKDLKGNIFLAINDEIELDSNLDFNLNGLRQISNKQAIVQVRGLSLKSKNQTSFASLKACSILIKAKELEELFAEELPKHKSFSVNQPLLKKKIWRYRNAYLKNVELASPSITMVKFNGSNAADFKARARVTLKGEVEKGGLGAIFKKNTIWKTYPWQALATVNSLGTFKYSFLPSDYLDGSLLDYELTLKLKKPEDLELDWTKVNSGLLGGAERNIIVSSIKKSSLFDEKKEASLKISRKVNLFNNEKAHGLVKHLKIEAFSTTPQTDGTLIKFKCLVRL
jgi:hypothetical protein